MRPWSGAVSAVGTPPTDRGYQITTSPRPPFQIHWFTGVAYLSPEDTFNHVHDITGASFVALPYGRQGYRSAYQAVELPSLTVLCDPGDPDNMPPVCIVVKGEDCEALGWQRLQALSAPFKPTRVDLAFDDFPFSPDEFKSHVLNGSVRTRAHRRTLDYHEDWDKYEELGHPGQTSSLGGRGSSQFFRCYNSRGFDRGELELKGSLAEAAYELLQAPIDQARETALSFLRRFIDFVDTSTSTNKKRQWLLPAWAVWLDGISKAVVDLPPRPVQVLDRVWSWAKKQLAPSLALLQTADPQGFASLLELGERRWSQKHRLLLGAGSAFTAV